MSSGAVQYTIQVKQNIPSPGWFYVVEMVVYNDTNGGTWSAVDGKYILTLGGAHTAGALRFFDGTSYFVVAIGNQSGQTWTAIAPDLAPADTALAVLPTYYGSGVRDTTPQFWNYGSFTTVDKENRTLSITAPTNAAPGGVIAELTIGAPGA